MNFILGKLAKWYLMKYMKGLKHTELVINQDFWTYRARDKDKERSMKKTLDMIK